MKKIFKSDIHSSKELRRRPYGDTVERTFKVQMTLSVMAIIACIIALFSTTFAYYYRELDSGNNSISAASWSLKVEYENENNKIISGEYTLKLVKDEIHTFYISPSGDATEGYCVIKISDSEGTHYYTTYVFDSSEYITFRLMAKEGSVISFKAHWGTPAVFITDPGDGTLNIRHSYSIPYMYEVKTGDTLIDIAEYYGVDASVILAYNGITSLDQVSVGDKIGIIGSDVSTEYYNRSVDREYVIQNGDTLSGIALMFNVSIEDLMAYNGIRDKSKINAGDKIIIPALTAVITTASDTTVSAPESSVSPETTAAAEETAQNTENMGEPVSSETSATPETTAAPLESATPSEQ